MKWSEKTPKNRIRLVLDKKKKSQYWLAKETKLTYVTVTGYYHGKSEPSLDSLFLIADALEVNPKDLLNS